MENPIDRWPVMVPLNEVRGAVSGASGRDLVVSRVMIDPVTVTDDRGEWIEIANVGSVAADLAKSRTVAGKHGCGLQRPHGGA